MDNEMFCFQCEQTAGGTGCSRFGACGKDPNVAALQDLLIHILKGIGFYGHKIISNGGTIDDRTDRFILDAIFSTLTNVNFSQERFYTFIKQGDSIKEALKEQVGEPTGNVPESATYRSPETLDEMISDGKNRGILIDPKLDKDVLSLREMVTYGLKGTGAYAHHSAVLGRTDKEVYKFFYKLLAQLLNDNLSINELFELAMELGKMNYRCMELLDDANTSIYGHPEPTQALVTQKKGPFIIISGHDFKDLKDLLDQTEGKGINIYTHGEMLPANAYPEFKKYSHLVGNFGGAWQEQQKEFDNIPGCILMTTNCLQPPKESYKDRIFTSSIVGFPDISHIEEVGVIKDFTPIIQKALELGGWQEDQPEKRILIGFGRNATLSYADKIIDAVKKGQIKHFFLIGGCDGAKPGRSYYTELAEKAPKDTIILTLACGKYRFNKLDLGTIGELPRLLDVGQCNDSYSAIRIALALAEAFNCGVNELPLSLILSWYEQKAIAVLLTLLSLGIKNIRVGPTLPAFITPNVLSILQDKFNLMPITTAEQDLKAILG